MKRVNMLGKRFGKLIVVNEGYVPEKTKKKRPYWKCICDCGKEVNIKADYLRSGDVHSCGCFRKERLEINLLNQKFGKLKVTGKAKKRGVSSSVFWKCMCDCGREHIVSSQHLREGSVKSCGCLYQRTENEELERAKDIFFKHIDKNNECWEWEGAKIKGYGVLWFGKRTFKAHRFSYLIHKGKIQAGKFICHTCDNKACVNPDHLYQGTAKDNAKDAIERNRLCCGENNYNAKLSKEQVMKIIKSKAKGVDLALEYSVDKNTICAIRKRKSWKHLEDASGGTYSRISQ